MGAETQNTYINGQAETNICHEWGSNLRPPTQFLWTMIDRAIVADNTPTYHQKLLAQRRWRVGRKFDNDRGII